MNDKMKLNYSKLSPEEKQLKNDKRKLNYSKSFSEKKEIDKQYYINLSPEKKENKFNNIHKRRKLLSLNPILLDDDEDNNINEINDNIDKDDESFVLNIEYDL
jgi:hypothetical protein